MNDEYQRYLSNAIAIFALGALMIFLCGQAKADEHYGNFITTQPKLEFVFDASLLADMLTTNDIRYSNMVETNCLLGTKPSAVKIAGYGASVALLHAAITYELVSQDVPSVIVTAWEAVSIGVEAGYVAHNVSIGLHFKF